VLKTAALLVPSLLALACDATRDGHKESPPGAMVQAGTSTISDIVKGPGACMRREGDWWTYAAVATTGARASVTKHPDPPGWYAIVVTGEDGEISLGTVNTTDELVFWFDPREAGDSVRREGRTEYSGQTRDEARAEWITPRGEQLVRLAQQAESTCSRSP